MKRIIVGITGASGSIYGVRTLRALRECGGIEAHLVMSAQARRTLEIETDLRPADVLQLADVVHEPDDVAASISSGSFRTDGMIVIPCSVKSATSIAYSRNDNLIARAADVCLKEKRRLVIVIRETPLHLGHLRALTQLAEMGAVVLPPVPGFYAKPQSIDDIVDHTVGKALDLLGVDHALFRRWGDPAKN